MLRIPGMPLLPGTLFRDLSKTHYPKQQSLMNYKGISMLSDRKSPTLVDPGGMIIDPNCPPTQVPSLHPPKSGPRLPPWIAYDKKVLCFNAYFKETLQEVYHAPYQVRKVKIFYYLEDGTMQITEPKVENSGIPQGCLVHRQRVPKPPPCEKDFISILDLNVNITIQIFDRVYHITDCDLFTRHFLNKSGISVADPVEDPIDPSTEIRKRTSMKVQNVPPKKHPFAQFLALDRHVLKFYGYWDDRSEFGDVRRLEVCYYLADDTMDIKETFPRNSGREGPSIFLKRGKLPREWAGMPLPGEQTPFSLLNVLGTNMSNVRFVVDPLDTGRKEIFYYTDRDLQIGTVLNVFGRAVVLTDCDEFTKSYFRKRYGVESFIPAPMPARIDDCAPAKQKERILPPYNGWGSYEDSEGNCISVEPKPPQADFKKFIQLDRYVLRFGAKLLSTIRENCERVFIISYFLSDDTIQIFEIAERNSGFLGGEFMKRTRIPLPGQEKFISKRPQYYEPYNFYIGATISLKDHLFHVVSADEYTLIYMEHHTAQFPLADIKAIMQKIRVAAKGENYKRFVCKCMPAGGSRDPKDVYFIGYDSLKRALIDLLGNNITNHEIITVCRHYSAEQAPPQMCEREHVRAAVHLELKRTLWNAMDELKEHLYHINPLNKPFLPQSKIRSALKGCRLPFSLELIENILSVLNQNDCGEIEVCDMMNFLDMGCGKPPDIAPVNIAFELCPKIPFLHKGRLINFNCFLQHLSVEDDVRKDGTDLGIHPLGPGMPALPPGMAGMQHSGQATGGIAGPGMGLGAQTKQTPGAMEAYGQQAKLIPGGQANTGAEMALDYGGQGPMEQGMSYGTQGNAMPGGGPHGGHMNVANQGALGQGGQGLEGIQNAHGVQGGMGGGVAHGQGTLGTGLGFGDPGTGLNYGGRGNMGPNQHQCDEDSIELNTMQDDRGMVGPNYTHDGQGGAMMDGRDNQDGVVHGDRNTMEHGMGHGGRVAMGSGGENQMHPRMGHVDQRSMGSGMGREIHETMGQVTMDRDGQNLMGPPMRNQDGQGMMGQNIGHDGQGMMGQGMGRDDQGGMSPGMNQGGHGMTGPGMGQGGQGLTRPGMGGEGQEPMGQGMGRGGQGMMRPDMDRDNQAMMGPGMGRDNAGTMRQGMGRNGKGQMGQGIDRDGQGMMRPGMGRDGQGGQGITRPGTERDGQGAMGQGVGCGGIRILGQDMVQDGQGGMNPGMNQGSHNMTGPGMSQGGQHLTRPKMGREGQGPMGQGMGHDGQGMMGSGMGRDNQGMMGPGMGHDEPGMMRPSMGRDGQGQMGQGAGRDGRNRQMGHGMGRDGQGTGMTHNYDQTGYGGQNNLNSPMERTHGGQSNRGMGINQGGQNSTEPGKMNHANDFNRNIGGQGMGSPGRGFNHGGQGNMPQGFDGGHRNMGPNTNHCNNNMGPNPACRDNMGTRERPQNGHGNMNSKC